MLCIIIHEVNISCSTSFLQKCAGPAIIAKRDWKTPNARSTSFRRDSCFMAKYIFLECDSRIVCTIVDHFAKLLCFVVLFKLLCIFYFNFMYVYYYYVECLLYSVIL